ncbi:MvaI/BcnI family restriction endonuclease [Moritella dasanensis]|uniref:MvaI/BcnI family restriction endonuclease n=1 Tax=Moritella dasanensis TaxID=428031 RepID=UPI000369F4FE|nr:MvaI/BcnI family restriction endonuclease [Moritella dasanensis]
MKPAVYDSIQAENLTIDELKENFRSHGIRRLLFKRLSPNDNSKNQPYMAGHLTDLSFLPTPEIIPSVSSSNKKNNKRSAKFCAPLSWTWLSPDNLLFEAPNAQVIYYPQYPEVRLSGFLLGAKIDISRLMSPLKDGRSKGRVLFLGVREHDVIAYLASPESIISDKINSTVPDFTEGVFEELDFSNKGEEDQINEISITYLLQSNKNKLLSELTRIHLKGWIPSKRYTADGTIIPYTAPNGGGYTLETELGIIPNGSSDPDYKGWEVKQYGVTNFQSKAAKALTLMTPEPDGGYYVASGVNEFMQKFGYLDSKKEHRINFNGRHDALTLNKKTQLRLVVEGFNIEKRMMTDPFGYIGLIDGNENIAASWSFSKLLEHWKNKHSRAVYVQSINQVVEDTKQYYYGKTVSLYEGCNINTLLNSIALGVIYYDPGIKLENINTDKPKSKRRSQFRVKSTELHKLYDKQEIIDLA